MSLFIPDVFGIRGPPVVTIASLSPLPGEKRWNALVPGVAYRWAKKKEKVAHFGNLHRCSSRSRLVSGDLDT